MNEDCYQIIDKVRFNYSDSYWDLFKSSPGDGSCAVNLCLTGKNEDFYSVEKIPSEENDKVFRVFDSILTVNSDFTKGTIISDKNSIKGIYGCAMVCLYGNFIRKDTLVLHGSLVDFNGKGIIFTGPSGAGKTTQAQLWEKYAGAEIINGDMIFLHKENNGSFYAYGSPWHGSSDYCVNKKVRVEGIFAVKKSSRCFASLPDFSMRLKEIFSEVMLPDWFDGCKCYGLNTLDSLLKCVPVYSFECTKDKNSVSEIEKMLSL